MTRPPGAKNTVNSSKSLLWWRGLWCKCSAKDLLFFRCFDLLFEEDLAKFECRSFSISGRPREVDRPRLKLRSAIDLAAFPASLKPLLKFLLARRTIARPLDELRSSSSSPSLRPDNDRRSRAARLLASGFAARAALRAACF